MLDDEIELLELKKIINFHKEQFGINHEISASLYLSIKDEIFNVINLFSLLDNQFKDDIIENFCEDSLSLLNYLDGIMNNIKNTEDKESYTKFNPLKRELLLIINTKIYFLDLYIWEKVNNSQYIKNYLRGNNTLGVDNTVEFIAKHDDFNMLVKTKFILERINLYIRYNKDDISMISTLDNFKDRRKNMPLRRLIDAKNSISFFKDMDAEDIKYIIKNLEFVKYKKNEVIVTEGEKTSQIYFLMSGCANVFVNGKSVGNIESNQIFGEFSSILKEKRQATVRAYDECTVLRFNLAFELFENNVYSFSVLYRNIINELVKKILSLNEKK